MGEEIDVGCARPTGGPDGVVQGYEVLTPPVGRNVGETFRQVQAFQLVRESKGSEAHLPAGNPAK